MKPTIEIAPKEYEIEADWWDARFYCFSLVIEGKSGWRLPTIEELKLFYDQVSDLKGWYWSSDELDSNEAYDADFHCFRTEFSSEYKAYSGNRVRPVRDLTDD